MCVSTQTSVEVQEKLGIRIALGMGIFRRRGGATTAARGTDQFVFVPFFQALKGRLQEGQPIIVRDPSQLRLALVAMHDALDVTQRFSQIVAHLSHRLPLRGDFLHFAQGALEGVQPVDDRRELRVDHAPALFVVRFVDGFM